MIACRDYGACKETLSTSYFALLYGIQRIFAKVGKKHFILEVVVFFLSQNAIQGVECNCWDEGDCGEGGNSDFFTMILCVQ